MNDSRGYKRAEKSFSGWRYIGFSAADLSYGLLYFWIASFLSIYYTDVFGISASAVSIMLLVVRVYDAVIDPIIGSLMDNHRTKMGRFRPWVLVGGVLMAISVVMLFWAHPGWSEPAKIVYMYMTYIFNCTAMSIFYMAYGALGGTISANSMIRARANSCRFAFSGIANLGIGYFVPAMLAFFGAESMVRGYLYSVVICGAIAIPMVVVTTFSTKEVIQPDVEVKPPFKDQLRSFVTNKPMILLAFVFFLQGSSNTFRQTAAAYSRSCVRFPRPAS